MERPEDSEEWEVGSLEDIKRTDGWMQQQSGLAGWPCHLKEIAEPPRPRCPKSEHQGS